MIKNISDQDVAEVVNIHFGLNDFAKYTIMERIYGLV